MKEIIYEVQERIESGDFATKNDIEALTNEIEKMKYEIQMERFRETCKDFKKDSEKFVKLLDEIQRKYG